MSPSSIFSMIESQYQSDKRDEISERTAFGRYGNIFLSEAEYAQLRLDYPGDLDRYIEEMSRYLSAHGRTYKNYEAAVRMWAANDKKQSADHGSADYSYERVPIYRKMALTIREAAEYSNIGINKIDAMLKQPNCPFVLYVGNKKLVKRREFEDFIHAQLVI